MNFLNTHIMLASLLTGWALDIIFGDPSRLPHPVVYMGRWISMGEHRLNRGKRKRLKGAVFAVSSILMTFGIMWLLTEALRMLTDSYDTGWAFPLLPGSFPPQDKFLLPCRKDAAPRSEDGIRKTRTGT